MSRAMILDEPLFTVSDAARLASVPPNTLRNWFQKGIFSLQKVDREAPAGGTRKLSVRRVLQLCIGAELIEMGIAPAAAALHAFNFSDVGNGKLPGIAEERLPGELYPSNCFTWLVVRKGEQLGRITKVTSETAATTLIGPRGERLPCLVLPLDPIVQRVSAALNASATNAND